MNGMSEKEIKFVRPLETVALPQYRTNLLADDNEFHVFAEIEMDLINQLNIKLADLKYYLESNKLQLNVMKTFWMGMSGGEGALSRLCMRIILSPKLLSLSTSDLRSMLT